MVLSETTLFNKVNYAELHTVCTQIHMSLIYQLIVLKRKTKFTSIKWMFIRKQYSYSQTICCAQEPAVTACITLAIFADKICLPSRDKWTLSPSNSWAEAVMFLWMTIDRLGKLWPAMMFLQQLLWLNISFLNAFLKSGIWSTLWSTLE